MRFRLGRKKRPRAWVIATTIAPTQVSAHPEDCAILNASSGHDPVKQSEVLGADASGTPIASVASVRPVVSGSLARRAKLRISMVATCFIIAGFGLGMRLADISFSNLGVTQSRAQAIAQNGHRPDIVDRNGVLLATNLPTIALEIDGKDVWDARETVASLATVLPDLDTLSFEKKLGRKQYVEVRSGLSPAEHAQIFALGLPGVHFPRRDHRFYPQEGLAPHLIGHVEKGRARFGDGGVMGFEKVLDRFGHELPGGNDALVASIDVRVQQALEEIVGEAMLHYSAEAAWGGVIDVTTGEMLAMASFPEFNLNDPSASAMDSRRNRMSYDRFDLGSAFKAITAASILDSGIGNEDSAYDARRGSFKVGGVTISDYKGKNRILTLSEVVQFSSNICSARMSRQLGPSLQQHYLKSLGMMEALPISLAENRMPDLPKKWGPVECATVSYGHGISVTPLHLLAAFATVVNDGTWRSPVFFRNLESQQVRQVFSQSTTASMRRVLRRTVLNGSAKSAEVPGYFVIGKTSTADKPRNGGYDRNARISTFVGAFPGHQPRYAVLVSLDNPQPTAQTHGYATAGWTAAPMFQKLVSRIGPILEVPIVDEQTAMAGFFADQQNIAVPQTLSARSSEQVRGR